MASARVALSPLSTMAQPALRPEVRAEQSSSKPTLDGAFLERRMKLHRQLQAAMAEYLTEEIFEEVRAALEKRR